MTTEQASAQIAETAPQHTAPSGLLIANTEPAPPNPRWWTKARLKAAQLIAEGEMLPAVARAIGKSRYWLWETRQEPCFVARVASIRDRVNQALIDEAIAHKAQRIAAKQDRWYRLKEVITQRSETPAPSVQTATGTRDDVPGWDTGLLVHTVKVAGGRNPVYFDEYAVDTGLLSEMRQLERSAAEELGQITPSKDGAGVLRELIVREYAGWPAQIE